MTQPPVQKSFTILKLSLLTSFAISASVALPAYAFGFRDLTPPYYTNIKDIVDYEASAIYPHVVFDYENYQNTGSPLDYSHSAVRIISDFATIVKVSASETDIDIIAGYMEVHGFVSYGVVAELSKGENHKINIKQTNSISVDSSYNYNDSGLHLIGAGITATSVGGDLTSRVLSQAATQIGAPLSHENGGNGGDVKVTATSGITILGDGGAGILAQSIGGSGGNGRSIGNSVALIGGGVVGDKADAGGDGGKVEVNFIGDIFTNGDIYTNGMASDGILAHSIGGSGGVGHGTTSGAALAAVAIGGAGGGGGHGGEVIISQGKHTKLEIHGELSAGILAQSIGGGGGRGGNAKATAAFYAHAVGGSGGGGGNGGVVKVSNLGKINTYKSHSTGIHAQSIGGGGGIGGSASAHSAAPFFSVASAVGGKGGKGGSGATTTVRNEGEIKTLGDFSSAVRSQSIGGGGGHGGHAHAVAASVSASGDMPSVSLSFSMGGAGGTGGNAGKAVASSIDTISTKGAHSVGLSAESVGGGGGSGGNAVAVAVSAATTVAVSASVTIGGKGGSASNGGKATVANGGNISTEGDFSTGLYAQSVGGGGGHGGSATSISVAAAIGEQEASGAVAVSVALAGKGGKGGKAENVVAFHKSGDIRTKGMRSYGVHAVSIGGGGGSGGHATSIDVALNLNASEEQTKQASADIAVTLGGGGGSGGTSGHAYAVIAGDVSTLDHQSHGVFAQSIAGGGGSGGSVTSITATATGKINPVTESGDASTLLAGAASVAIGGKAGYGNYAAPAMIWLKDGAQISTKGAGAHAVFAQSIGGSGGDGGSATDYTASLRFSSKFEMEPAKIHDVPTGKSFPQNNLGKGHSVNLQVAIGGSGGYAGDGAAVTVNVDQNTKITTEGINSTAIFAQSVGGGGGNGGSAHNVVYSANKSKSFGFALGGSGRMGGTGGAIAINEMSNDTPVTKLVDYASATPKTIADAGIITTGQQAHGIHAQSVGGGGGNGGAAHLDNYSINSKTPVNGGTSVAFNIGGSGGVAGNGGTISIKRDNIIATLGHQSHGIFAQSIAGGGGNAGAVSVKLKGISLGGSGGGAGYGQQVNIVGKNNIQTQGHQSYGIFAQSIGGGGGQASSLYGNSKVIDRGLFILGGDGGKANHGGEVLITESGAIVTKGENSHAIMAQSIGGGGGNIQMHNFGNSILNKIPEWRLKGGKGDGGKVELILNNSSSISTYGKNANAVFAQSIGGGGGIVSETGAQSQTQNGVLNISKAASSSHSGKGEGGAVSIQNYGKITTHGENAVGLFAQSVGGGGVQVGNHRFKVAQSKHSSGSASKAIIGNLGDIIVNANGGAAIRAESIGYAHGRNFNSSGISIYNKGNVIAKQGSVGVLARLDAHCPLGAKHCIDGIFLLDNYGNIQSSHAITLELNQYSAAPSQINNYGNISGDIHYFSQYEKTKSANDLKHMPNLTIHNRHIFSGGVYAANDGQPAFLNENIKKSNNVRLINYQNATYNSGSYVHAAVTNHGLVNPGGAGAVRVSRFKQLMNRTSFEYGVKSTKPILQFDVDFKRGISDEITALVSEDFGYVEIEINTIGAIKTNNQVHTLVDMGDKASITPHKIKESHLDTPVVNYHLKIDKNTIKLVGATVDYTKAAASKNSQNLANNLVSATVANAVAKSASQPINAAKIVSSNNAEIEMALAALANAPDAQSVKQVFESLTVEGVTTMQAVITTESLNFISNDTACSIDGMSHMGEGQVYCGSAIANVKLGFHDGMGVGADYTDRLFEIGARVGGKLNESIVYSVALSSGYVGASVGASELSGKFIRVGGEIAYDLGDFRLKAMGMLGYGWFDQTRNIGINGMIANSEFNIVSGAIGFGIDKQFMFDGLKITPGVDVLAAFTHTTQAKEIGGGALATTIGADTDYTFAIKPHVSFSTVKKLDNGWTMSPKLKLGATWLIDNQFEHDIGFHNSAALGNISQQRNHDSVTLDVNLGVEFKRGENLSINLGYSGNFGLSAQNHSLNAGLKYKF